jgi:ketosteroid isomerase-like protein
MLKLVLLAVPLALLTACASVDTRAEGEAVMQRSRDWSASIATRDADTIASFWADDAVVMPAGMSALKTNAQRHDFVKAALDTPGFDISWEPVGAHVAESGDLAYLVERITSTANDESGNPVTSHANCVTVWRKRAGTWKCVADIWTESGD